MKQLLVAVLLVGGLILPVSAQQNVLDKVYVENAASFETDFPVSPGCWAVVFADFASIGVTDNIAQSVPFPTILGSVQVFVNGVASPMNYAGPAQVNFLVPKDTPTANSKVDFRIDVGGATVYTGKISIWPVSPGLLTLNPADPTRPAAAVNVADGTINSEQHPAKRGDLVTFYGVGADFAELPDDGAVAPSDHYVYTTSTAAVYIDVIPATVQFSGLTPTLVNAWQINAYIPDQPQVKGHVTVIAEIQGLKTVPVSIWVEE